MNEETAPARSDPVGHNRLRVGSVVCSCAEPRHSPTFIAVTGGPGAGKTAVLEMAARVFCTHTGILPEAATIIFGGGFPRHDTEVGVKAAQRAIYAVQYEVERLVSQERQVAVGLCDRGTVDGVAYWPGDPSSFWTEVGTTKEREFARYSAVIHLEVPPPERGYERNPIRIEDAQRAHEIDHRIAEAWAGHPRRYVVESSLDFVAKAHRALSIIRAELPRCCRAHELGHD